MPAPEGIVGQYDLEGGVEDWRRLNERHQRLRTGESKESKAHNESDNKKLIRNILKFTLTQADMSQRDYIYILCLFPQPMGFSRRNCIQNDSYPLVRPPLLDMTRRPSWNPLAYMTWTATWPPTIGPWKTSGAAARPGPGGGRGSRVVALFSPSSSAWPGLLLGGN